MAKLTGTVVAVTRAGDVVTDIAVAALESVPRDDRLRVSCEGHVTLGIYPTDHGQPEMTFVASEGASGFLELSLVGDDASRFLGIKPGAVVQLSWS